MKLLHLGAALILMAGMAAAQPSISGVVNAASGIVQALPNGGVAQGAIFLVVGSNLGPATLSVDHNPFTSTSLLGTSVSVTVNGSTVGVLMYYTSATQVAGLLPSNTPLGAGTVSVTYNNATSAPAPINVVQNNAGVFTTPSGGAGAAVITYPDYSVVSTFPGNACGGPNTVCGAANPKDVLVLWLTGLGPVSAPDSSGPQPGNMPNIPLKLWIGGVPAPVSYQGRSGCCIGVDQVVFTVPDNVPTGCSVPLFVQIGDEISNYTAIPVANGSRSCTPTNPVFTPDVLSAVTGGGAVTSTQIKLRRRPNNNGQGSVDRADAQFQRGSVAPGMLPFALSLLDVPPLGSCLVLNNPNLDISQAAFVIQGGIDAGPSLNLTGPNGNKVMSKTATAGQPTDYFVSIGPGYYAPGDYTVTGSGGSDIGPFSAMLTIPAPAVWTNQAAVNTITRANGLTINWTGGASQYLVITGGSYTDTSLNTGALFQCLTAGEAGTFTIPATVLLALPAVAASPNGFVTFQPASLSNAFKASGLTLGSIDFNSNVTNQVTYK